MSDEDDDDDFFDFDEMEKKTFVTLQDSSVIQHLSFYQQNSTMFRYFILAASPLASSGFAAIGDWKGLCHFQTSIYTIF